MATEREAEEPLLPVIQAQPPLPTRSFVYPLLGIPYLFTHRELHPPVISRIFPLTILSLVVITFFFAFLYVPHLVVLELMHSPFPAYNAVTMILSECAAVVAIVAESFMTEHQIVDVFDTIFIESGLPTALPAVSQAREVQVSPELKLGKHRVNPYLKFAASIRTTAYFLLELPLNWIPMVGPPLFVMMQGYHLGPLHHYRYLQLLGWDRKMRDEYVKKNRARYALFGIVHVTLQLVPVLSILFLFTTATGAARWAVEAERRRLGRQEEGRVGRGQGRGRFGLRFWR